MQLTPDTVRPGDVCLVTPRNGASFVERQTGPAASPGPLTDRQIARISGGVTFCPRAHGDCFQAYRHDHPDEMKNTVVSTLATGYCDSRDDPPPGVRGGERCYQMLVQLRPGRYLVSLGAMPVDGYAVLTVTP